MEKTKKRLVKSFAFLENRVGYWKLEVEGREKNEPKKESSIFDAGM